ncbi:Sugar lactone lactonase YvrE [Granulicella rosea]|uniref:Sugar lactone lactonase YvrE n=1 Tax=Granulicella rosea TaxID=474952 RepID=A0A239J3I8_9BACT|nr:Ig-like domain repeat protein [Granulicella rosea]SNT00370.1 Sugar lactone lactonase YvrE [Granulicella rosea]
MVKLSCNDPLRRSPRLTRLLRVALCLVLLAGAPGWGQSAQVTPLLLPGGIAFDQQGNLYVAETGAHRIRRIDSTGALTTVAGAGVQGFGGDGGPATAALLDSPSSVALDATGDLFLADAHNHRVRRVDAVSGVITTFAGTGAAGSAGDGGLATAATLDLPTALALDGAGNLYIADGRSHRIRRVAAATGLIATVAGSGEQGFAGDGGLATAAQFDSPGGLAVDAAGNLFIADSHNQRVRRVDATTRIVTTVASALNLPRGVTLDAAGNIYVADLHSHRIRRIDAGTGAITSVAGEGTELFAGDGTPAVTASLDSPRGVAVSPAGLVTLADTADQRIRQIDAQAIIHTIGGVGGLASGTLTLAAPASTVYGTGTATATLTSSPATGSVAFLDTTGGVSTTLGIASLTGNAAAFSLGGLAAGSHLLSADYGGDALHAPAASGAAPLEIAPAPVTAVPAPAATLYGQALPALGGTVSGVLAQDAGKVSVVFSSAATQFSAPGAYAITAALTGSLAGNYALSYAPGAVTIGQAPSTATVTPSPVSAALGSVVNIALHVASNTAGIPTGVVKLLDGGTAIASATLSATGDALVTVSTLGLGTHSLTAAYAGDVDFLGSVSQAAVETIGVAANPDFTLAVSGAASQTVSAGSAAVFNFAVAQVASQGSTLASPIELSVSGLPAGATASFSPALLPPAASQGFTLTVQTAKTASLRLPVVVFVCLLLPGLFLRGRRRVVLLLALPLLLAGCGARVKTAGGVATTANLVVTGTATSAAGAPILHSVAVTLVVQ